MNLNIPSDILLVVPVREGYSGITIDLGLLYLYSALKDKDINSTILHCPKEKIDYYGWERILRQNPQIKIIGFKMYSVDHNPIKRMSQQVKRILPNCTTIAGGPHPTSIPDYVLSDVKSIDFLLTGEAEFSFPEFCKSILSNSSVHNLPGLVYRTKKGIISNKAQAIDNLDLLPRVRWEDVAIEEYPDFFSSLPFIPVMATRGCPYLCKYCAAHRVFGRRMRFRSVDNVIGELSFLRNRLRLNSVTFIDDELTLNRKYITDLCRAIIDAGLDIKWECDNGVRLDTLDEELLELMYNAGCRYVAVGIESASDRILKNMKKNIDAATIRQKVALLKRSKVVPQGLFMLGFPEETEADIRETIKFSLELDIDKTNFSIFMPLPGSETFSELLKENKLSLNKINWDDMKPDRIVWENETVTRNRLKFLQKYAYLRFYMRPGPLKRLLREFLFKKGSLRILSSKIKSVLWR